MVTEEKLEKFILRIDRFIEELRSHEKLEVHSHINQFYYMQKMEELKLQQDNLREALKRLTVVQQHLDVNYKEIFCRWSQEARWLRRNRPRIERSVT